MYISLFYIECIYAGDRGLCPGGAAVFCENIKKTAIESQSRAHYLFENSVQKCILQSPVRQILFAITRVVVVSDTHEDRGLSCINIHIDKMGGMQ